MKRQCFKSLLGLCVVIFFSACGSTSSITNSIDSINPFKSSAINQHIAPPTDIKVLTDINTIAFEWNLVPQPEIKGYYIYRKLPTEQDFKRVANVKSRFTTHYSDNGLSPDTEYLYQFVSYDQNGNVSANSDIITTKTQFIEPVEYIEAIGNYPRKIKIIWSPHKDPRVTGYLLEKRTNNGEWKELTKINDRLLVEYLDKDLQDGQSNEYRIAAFNINKSLSLPTMGVVATTKQKPAPATNFRATNNIANQIQLTWTPSTSNEVVSYTILRSSIFGTYSKLVSLDSSISTYVDSIDDVGKEYQYKIIAYDKDGIDSIETGPVTGRSLSKPNPPTITYAQIEGDAVVIRWDPNEPRAREYVVYKESSIFSEILRYNKVLTPEFIDREIRPGEQYTYSVGTLDEHGIESDRSKKVNLELPK